MISKTSFGMTSEGEEAFLYTLTTEKGMTIKVTNYGATLCSVSLQDKDGNYRDVVLGYDDVSGYDRKAGTRFGTTVERNEFSNRLWGEKDFTDHSVTFKIHSPAGDQGYSDAVDMELTYVVNDNNICIVHSAKSEEKAFLNGKDHSYFNLNGRESGSILEHQIWINSDAYVESDKGPSPTGRILDVENTPMDFRKLKNDMDFEKVAMLYSEQSGIAMEVYTDMPGIHIDTGNFIQDEKGKQGAAYRENQGVCVEPRYFPNAIRVSELKNDTAEKDKKSCSVTVFKFVV